MFVLVCLCRFLRQIILLTYFSYELVAHFDPSLDLFLGDFWISSPLFSKSEQIQWILYELTVHTCCWSACKQAVVFLLFTLSMIFFFFFFFFFTFLLLNQEHGVNNERSQFCIRSSARSDLLLVSHEALLTMQQRLSMIYFIFTFLLLNQEHGVNNERSQSIQSVHHSKRTHRMWSRQKDHSTRVKKKKKKCS